MLETFPESEVLTDKIRALISDKYPQIQTESDMLNMAYFGRAYAILSDNPGFNWLCADGNLEPAILMELGKIKDIDAMVRIAFEITLLKPESKDGELMVRYARLGKGKGNIMDLANEVINIINRYMIKHEISTDEIRYALQIVLGHADADSMNNQGYITYINNLIGYKTRKKG